jgi:hypothetical protein
MGRRVIQPTATFFSAPNEIVLSQLDAGLGQLLPSLRNRLDNSGFRTLLPAKVSGISRWYGLAPSPREGRLLRDELKCWLSRPLTAGLVEVSRLSTDPVDRAALELVAGGSVTRVEVAPGWDAEALQNVSCLNDVWAIEPDRSVDKPRPVGRVLRQFYEGLVGNDRPQAEAALDELRARALLSATNLRFLRVELLSSLGTPGELVDDPMLQSISLLARPPAVTESLAEAVDVTLIRPALDFEGSDLRSTAERLDLEWPALVTQVYQVTTPATARCYALVQFLLEKPQREDLRELSVRFPGDAVIAGVVRATGSEPKQAEQPVALDPVSLYYEGDYQAALDVVVTHVPSRSGAAVALAAAVNLNDSVSAAKALAVVDQLSDSVRAGLLDGAVERSFFESLRAMTSGDQVPTGWLDWLNGDWLDRPDLLAGWSREWARTPTDIAPIADELAGALIDALSDERRARIRNGLPVLVDWLIGGGISPSLVSLATTLFDIMLSSDPGRSERQAALSLFDEVLAVGCTVQEYRELLGAIVRELSVIGPRDCQWLAQALDLVIVSACQDPDERTNLLSRAVGVAKSWTDRLDERDALVLGLVFRDAGTEVSFSSSDAAPKVQDAAPVNSVGVYSLMESAIRVFAKWIGERWPEIRLRSSSGEVNSASLASLVKGVDVMLVQTSHAKHSATAAINMAIVDPQRLVLVHGRGATSLMRALLEWVEAA